MEPHFKRVVIHGVGLLGGSVGMALKKKGLADRVVGLGRSPEHLDRARELGAVDETTTEPADALRGADALISCLPPRNIRESFALVGSLLAPGAFVTDVGSVKRTIVEAGEKELGSDTLFIGSHPMAGSAESGVSAARDDLYEGACCIITPTERTLERALTTATGFWQALGARVTIMTPERHDHVLAGVSHLPHLAAASLVEGLYRDGDSTLLLREILGNGFRDATRIAGADPTLWTQIFAENRTALLENLDAHLEIMREWRELLAREDAGIDIMERLEKARDHRRELNP